MRTPNTATFPTVAHWPLWFVERMRPQTVVAHGGQRVEQHGKSAAEPSRRRGSGGPDELLEEGDQEDRESEGVQHRCHHRCEPHHPTHREGRLDRQYLAGIGVGAAGLGKTRGELRKGQSREDGDATVQGKGDDGAGSGRGECDTGEGEHAATHDCTDADTGGSPEVKGSAAVIVRLRHGVKDRRTSRFPGDAGDHRAPAENPCLTGLNRPLTLSRSAMGPCFTRRRRQFDQTLWEGMLDLVSNEPDIQLAYPTQRLVGLKGEAQAFAGAPTRAHRELVEG